MKTLVDFFFHAARSGREDLLLHRKDGAWAAVSAREFDENVRALASALAGRGVQSGDRIAILSENRPEWAMADFATLCSGAVTVPIYTSYEVPQIAALLRDSGAVIAFAGSSSAAEKILAAKPDSPRIRAVISLAPGRAPRGAIARDAFLKEGHARMQARPEEFAERAGRVRPEDLATLIYTSGTTGEPKGAMLTHENFVSDVEAGLQCNRLDRDDVALSFLPLAHVFERMLDYCYFSRACTIAYVDSVDAIGPALSQVRPTVFGAVPRVFEKIRERVLAAVEQSSAIRRSLFRRAFRAGRASVARREKGLPVPPWLSARVAFYDRLVLSKIRARLGGRFRYAVSGGAPLGRDTAEFFWAAGVELYEGYGLTETSPVVSTNFSGAWRLGSVGRVLPGVEIRTDPEGEIQVRGPVVMQGYWEKPAATAEAFTPDGWFRTGDIGFLDRDGFLYVTDRKKELLVSAYGKNIPPAPIEAALSALPEISAAVLIGDRRRFLSALIVPSFGRLKTRNGEQDVAIASRQEVCADPRTTALIANAVDRVNAGQPREFQVKRFALLPNEFSIESGELTPTLKVKRRVIAQRYRDVIESLYAEDNRGGLDGPPLRKSDDESD